MDDLVRDYVRDHLTYRFVETRDGAEALEIEDAVRRGGLKAGKPLFNSMT